MLSTHNEFPLGDLICLAYYVMYPAPK